MTPQDKGIKTAAYATSTVLEVLEERFYQEDIQAMLNDICFGGVIERFKLGRERLALAA